MDYKIIQELIKSMDSSKLTELEVSFEGVNIKMKKGDGITSPKTYVNLREDEDEDIKSVPLEKENTIVVKSPIVGTFYSSPGTDKAPYVKVGDRVKKGQILCIVEAMKLMNEIESEEDGEIAEILVQSNDMVEYGQALFKLIVNS